MSNWNFIPLKRRVRSCLLVKSQLELGTRLTMLIDRTFSVSIINKKILSRVKVDRYKDKRTIIKIQIMRGNKNRKYWYALLYDY